MHPWHDVRLAFRKLAGRPAYTALMVGTLALGIGANTAVFSVVDQTLLRVAPFIHADRLVDVLNLNRKNGGGGSNLTPRKIVAWQGQPSVFEALESYSPRQFDLTGEGQPERIDGLMVSTGLFGMLGVQPRLGRGFGETDGAPGGERIVIISEALWRTRYSGRAEVLGERIALNDELYTIVGVMPRRFRLLMEKESVWVPFNLRAGIGEPEDFGFYGLGRLAPGIAAGDAQALADGMADRLTTDAQIPGSWYLSLRPKKVARVNDATRTALLVVLGAVGFVLLITCANVANLFLSHAAARRREMAIRSALGATRLRLIREVLTESVVMAVFGGLLGVLLAIWGVRALVAAAPPRLMSQSTMPIEIDGRILALTAAVTLLTGILFGLVPALRGSSPKIEAMLRGSGGPGAGRSSTGHVPSLLVVAEVAFSLILLIGAALMMRTLANLERIDPGFEPKGLVAMHVDLPTDRYPTSAARAAFFDTVRDRLMAVPGVTDTTVTYGVPPDGGGFSIGVPQAEGSTVPATPANLFVPFNVITPEYFRTLNIPLVAGRTFAPHETTGNIIVSKALADRFWPDGSAVGRRFRLGAEGPWSTIVGVSGNVEGREARETRTAIMLYRPWIVRPAPAGAVPATPARRSYDWRLVVVRASDVKAALPLIKNAIWSVDANQPIEKVSSVEDLYAEAFARQRFVLQLMAAFAAIAVVLTAAGVFGVLSQVVAQRTREIGVRMALGARPADVVRLILSRGMALTLAGAALGLGGAFALSRFLESLLFEVRPHDPTTFAGVTAMLIAVALAACWLPVRAAMRVQPVVALRTE